jgi:hypothetical protein
MERAVKKGPDGCTWKSSGCTFIDDALYLVVARHKYGETSGDPQRRQTAQNASIIKSIDFGRTWTRPAAVNYQAPMFPGRRFATPYFIEFGREGWAHANVGDFVYALSNNGFWDCGDDVVLGRVARSKIGLLNGSDWEFFTGGDGGRRTSWTKNMMDAKPVLSEPGRFGMGGAVYLHAQRRYFMIGWFYPAGEGKWKGPELIPRGTSMSRPGHGVTGPGLALMNRPPPVTTRPVSVRSFRHQAKSLYLRLDTGKVRPTIA